MIQPLILTIFKKKCITRVCRADFQLRLLLLYKEKEALKKPKLAEYEKDFISGSDQHDWSERVSKLHQIVNNHITKR